jgi:hypothetical protein
MKKKITQYIRNMGHFYKTAISYTKLNGFLLTGWYRTKRPVYFDNFLIYCTSESDIIHPPEFSGKNQQS